MNQKTDHKKKIQEEFCNKNIFSMKVPEINLLKDINRLKMLENMHHFVNAG